jgi:putative flippase GtrA
VSVVAVGVSQPMLLLGTAVLDLRPVAANVVAVTIGSVPSYLLNRAWVWNRRGGHSLRREVLPFWIMGIVGLAFSTLLVHVASRWSDAPLVTNAANITAFGILWVLKYLILDTVLFGEAGEHDPAVLL